MNTRQPRQDECASGSAVELPTARHPLLAANQELRVYARARLQDLANTDYSPADDVALPDCPAVVQQAAAALLSQVLEYTEAPADLVYQIAATILHLTLQSDAGGVAGDGSQP